MVTKHEKIEVYKHENFDTPEFVDCNNIFKHEHLNETSSEPQQEFSKSNQLEVTYTNEKYCSLCKKILADQNEFMMHAKTHLKPKPHNKFHMVTPTKGHIECKLCEEKFLDIEARDEHTRAVHSTEDHFKCDHCDKIFKSNSAFNRHMGVFRLDKYKKSDYKDCTPKCLLVKPEDLQGNPKFECSGCTLLFDSEDSLKLHALRHLKGGEIKCDVCLKHFSTVLNLRKHYLQFHISKIATTSEVDVIDDESMDSDRLSNNPNEESPEKSSEKSNSRDKSDKPESSLKQLKHNKKNLVCDECTKSFETEEKLKLHAVGHLKEGEILCELCVKPFSSEKGFRIHYSKFHLSEVVSSSTKIVANKRKFSGTTNPHSKAAKSDNKKQFECEECTWSFDTEEILKLHVICHLKGTQLMFQPHLADEPLTNLDVCTIEDVKVEEHELTIEEHDVKVECT